MCVRQSTSLFQLCLRHVRKHGIWMRRWFNVGPASQTVAQPTLKLEHWASVSCLLAPSRGFPLTSRAGKTSTLWKTPCVPPPPTMLHELLRNRYHRYYHK